jgi:hypothetical protein
MGERGWMWEWEEYLMGCCLGGCCLGGLGGKNEALRAYITGLLSKHDIARSEAQ